MANVEPILSGMTLEQKVGQVLMDTFAAGKIDQIISELGPGSLLFWNFNDPGLELSPRKMALLTNSVQKLSIESRGLPMWLHGFVSSATMGWHGGWHASLATVASVEEVERVGQIFGRRWRVAGLHNFPGPTVNVPVHETCIARSWAMTGDAECVSRYGAATTRGVVSQRCGTMAQHFPAHGATPVDSHTGFPVVDLPREELMRDHIRPYQAPISTSDRM